MDIEAIKECDALSMDGKITFPEVVRKLASAGVERYIMDLVGHKKYSYGIAGETYTSSFQNKATSVALKFDDKAIKSAITEIQQNKIKYSTFLERIIAAGCSHYEVFIDGKKVIYFGRDGSHHIELFPLK